jgi:hypothetical protein
MSGLREHVPGRPDVFPVAVERRTGELSFVSRAVLPRQATRSLQEPAVDRTRHLIAHVVHSPPPPPANSFVIGPAVINTHTHTEPCVLEVVDAMPYRAWPVRGAETTAPRVACHHVHPEIFCACLPRPAELACTRHFCLMMILLLFLQKQNLDTSASSGVRGPEGAAACVIRVAVCVSSDLRCSRVLCRKCRQTKKCWQTKNAGKDNI